ncbi:aspartic peptidase domain-containing protein [Spinellus fusiger]|nr:aspartic peptidase domain-containing protein [Spinellus fusiger]
MRCLSLLLSSALVSLTLAELQRIPLYRRWDDSPGIKREPMIYDDGLLVAKVEVGTPAQEFSVLFDTSSSLAWVPSTKCHSSSCKQFSDHPYDTNKSSTAMDLHKKQSIKYGGGKCIDVELFRDTVSVAGLSVSNQLLGAAYSVTNIGDDKYIGYLGLGGYNEDGSTNFLNSTGKTVTSGSHEISSRQWYYGSAGYAQNAYQQGYGQQSQQFGMVVGDSSGFYGKRSESPQGEFIIGGIDHTLYKGEIAFLPLPTCSFGDSPYWKTALKCVKLGNAVDIKLTPKSLATLSSGTKFMSAPTKQANLLHKALGAEYDDATFTYKLDCDLIKDLPDLTFSFTNYKVTFPSSVYTAKSKTGECYSLIRRNTNEKDWILGTSFLNNFYHIYDLGNKRIGLAIPRGQCKAKIHKTGSRSHSSSDSKN